jgi:glycosyltransferase involved in cell wall biosynthesis
MILIDSVYINRSGSLLLLNDLIYELESKRKDIFYLFDDRVKDTYSQIPFERKFFIKAGFFNRLLFYLKRSREFEFVFCFGGVPPIYNKNKNLWCYFHNAALMNIKDLSLQGKIVMLLKVTYTKIFGYNVQTWLVQTSNVRAVIKRVFTINHTPVVIAPFFRIYSPLKNQVNNKKSFLYISDAYIHKNHERLFKAFEMLITTFPDVILYVTIDKSKIEYISLLNKYREKGINIINLGFDININIKELYEKADCVIFPSIAESLGLGLVEAAQMNLPILASNLDFVYAVIEPSLTFNPFEVDSIYKCINLFMHTNSVSTPKLLINNQLNWLVDNICQNNSSQVNL